MKKLITAFILLSNITIVQLFGQADITVIAHGDLMTSGVSSLDFGTVISEYDTPGAIVIVNTGDAPLTFDTPGATSSGTEIIVGSDIDGLMLAPGATTAITITFVASSSGAKSEIITINSDDPDEAAFTFTITATALEKPSPCSIPSMDMETSYGGSAPTTDFSTLTGANDFQAPSGWTPLYGFLFSLFGFDTDVQMTADAHNGTSALQLVSHSNALSDVFTIFPCASPQEKLTGYYKYTGETDAAFIVVSTGGGEEENRTEANSDTLVFTNTGTYTAFELSIKYDENSVDSLFIYAVSAAETDASVLILDDLSISAGADEVAPEVVSLSPEHEAVDVSIDTDLTMIFDEPIQKGSGYIAVTRIADNITFYFPDIGSSDITVSDNQMTMNLAQGLSYGDEFIVNIEDGAILDLAGNQLTGFDYPLESWTFTVEDDPVIRWDGSVWNNGTGPTASDDVVISGDFTGDFTCANLTVNSGNTLTVDGTLDVNGNLTNNGTFIVASGSSLLTYSGNTVSDNITIRRNTRYDDGRYSFFGTPVAEDPLITGSLFGAHVYKYDESVSSTTTDVDRWIDASSDILVPGVGYTEAFTGTLEFTGKPNDGEITNQIQLFNDAWHLVSNPYPAALDIDAFIDGNTNTTGSIYIWDDHGSLNSRGGNEHYIVANKVGATDTGGPDNVTRWNGYIGSMQGFFVQKDEKAANSTLTFNEAMRVAGNNDDANHFRKAEKGSIPKAKINLTHQDGTFIQTIVGWSSEVQDDLLSPGYDARIFSINSIYDIYTFKVGEPLAIQAITNKREIIPLTIKVKESGIYNIQVDLSESGGNSLYLRDNLKGTVVDASAGYEFSTEAGLINNRFELQTSSRVLRSDQKSTSFYVYDRALHVNIQDNKKHEFELVDLSGKVMLKRSFDQSGEIQLSIPSGVYIIRLGDDFLKVFLD